MIEVEIKLPLFRRSVTERTLTEFGFKPGNLVKESDFYFTSDFHDFMKTDEALRIRTCDNFNTRETASYCFHNKKRIGNPHRRCRNYKGDSYLPWLQKTLSGYEAPSVLP